MKVNGITISNVILRNVLANMILNGNEWDGSGKFYMYVVSQNYMTADGYIDTENWKLRILKRDNLELVTEAEFSKEGKVFQEALKYIQNPPSVG